MIALESYCRSPWLFLATGSAVGVAAFAFVLTPLLNIEPWALGDAGGHLVLPKLIDGGLIPNVDFAYTYGPATIALNYLWALAFGNSWQAFFVLFAALQLALAVSLAVFTYALRLPKIAALGCLLVLVHFMRFEYSIAHLAEKILLINAATAIAYGRYSGALTLCATSALFRPASGIIAGGLIIVGLAWHERAVRPLILAALPASSVIALVAATYSLWFGPSSFALTALPISGRKLYPAPSLTEPIADLVPRFLPEGQNVFGYLGSNPTHAILFALIGLVAFCVSFGALGRSDRRASAMAMLALATIITLFVSYSGGTFYRYYVPMLWLGLVAVAMLPSIWPVTRVPCFASLGLIIASLIVSLTYKAPIMARELANLASSNFQMLRASERLDADLHNILRRVPAVSAMPFMGDVSLLSASGVITVAPWSWCFRNQGFNLKPELDSARRQITSYPWFVVRNDQLDLFPLAHETKTVLSGRYLTLLRGSPDLSGSRQ
jgi:hypothetical protein